MCVSRGAALWAQALRVGFSDDDDLLRSHDGATRLWRVLTTFSRQFVYERVSHTYMESSFIYYNMYVYVLFVCVCVCVSYKDIPT